MAVRRIRMAMQVASQVVDLQQLRQRSLACRLDLAAVFAQLRRNERQADAFQYFCLGLAGQSLIATEHAVFVYLQALAGRYPAQRDVVRLRTREVIERRAVADPRHHAHVDLHSGA